MNSTFFNTQEAYNGKRTLTQQDIQTTSHFAGEEIVDALPITTQAQSISLFIRHLQHHIVKIRFPFHQRHYNQQSNYQSCRILHIWVINYKDR